ncbi:MAG: hypothetical protein ACPG5B_16570 [Chitinophagales bacterium]
MKLKDFFDNNRSLIKILPYFFMLLFVALFVGFNDEAIKAVAGLGFILTLLSFAMFREENDNQRSRMKQMEQEVVFENEYIKFFQAYEFKHSRLRENPHIRAHEINEMYLSSFPPSVVIDNKEVIFFGLKFKEELRLFAERNNIKIGKRLDIWENICKEYLHVEYTPVEKLAITKELIKNNITTHELMEIHYKIGRQMAFVNSYASEWVYLGQYDVLRTITPLSKAFYWYTMEIALRNLNK